MLVVSAEHGPLLVDLEAPNGTFIDGRRLEPFKGARLTEQHVRNWIGSYAPSPTYYSESLSILGSWPTGCITPELSVCRVFHPTHQRRWCPSGTRRGGTSSAWTRSATPRSRWASMRCWRTLPRSLPSAPRPASSSGLCVRVCARVYACVCGGGVRHLDAAFNTLDSVHASWS
jgi:hypothetical protein